MMNEKIPLPTVPVKINAFLFFCCFYLLGFLSHYHLQYRTCLINGMFLRFKSMKKQKKIHLRIYNSLLRLEHSYLQHFLYDVS